MRLSIQEIIPATGGRCLNNLEIGNKIIMSITTDTRQITDYSLFVPLKGERFDGHDFIDVAFEKGAIATLTQDLSLNREDKIVIWVADTQKALLDLARYYRQLHPIPVIGITGSVGKTTTKDLVAAVLSAKYNTLKTEGNFNNEIGLPLTLFRLEASHEVAVVEMGMNHFGEIHRLSLTANPDIAVITNIGVSHIENLGSREGILQAKLEIVDGLKDEGTLIINNDDDMLCQVTQKDYEVITCSIQSNGLYHASQIVQKDDGIEALVTTPKTSYNIKIPALGEHMVYNGLVAIAVAEKLNLSKLQIIEGLMAYKPSKMRMNIKTYPNKITVIDDAYNASPDSMLAAIKVLAEYKTKFKRIAILGDMFEMGEFAPTLHEQVGGFVAERDIQVVCCVGHLSKHMYLGAKQLQNEGLMCYYFETKEECINLLEKIVTPEDVVLVKASRGMQFEEIVKAIGKVNNHDD